MLISWIAWALLIIVGIAAWRMASVWLNSRGERLVTCPENQHEVAVELNAGRAAATALGGSPELRLSDCSRWPEKANCGQECLTQIRLAGADCLVANILAKWYEDKDCAACGQPIGNIDWGGSHPALLVGDQVSVEWEQVSADKLTETLRGALPICFACHTANRLVKEHPELVTDRHRAGLPM